MKPPADVDPEQKAKVSIEIKANGVLINDIGYAQKRIRETVFLRSKLSYKMKFLKNFTFIKLYYDNRYSTFFATRLPMC